MILLYAIEEIFIVLFVLVMISQVILPILSGKPLFPLFRWRKAEAANATLRDALDLAELEAENKRLQDQLNKENKIDGTATVSDDQPSH